MWFKKEKKYYRQLDWDKVKTTEDIILILRSIHPHINYSGKDNERASLVSHMLKEL
jgi:hypothetical protein